MPPTVILVIKIIITGGKTDSVFKNQANPTFRATAATRGEHLVLRVLVHYMHVSLLDIANNMALHNRPEHRCWISVLVARWSLYT